MKKMLLPLAFFISVLTSTILAATLLKIGAGLSNHFSGPHSFTQKEKNPAGYTIKILPSIGGTYGYEIYSHKKLLIRQINIPGQSGNRGFKKKIDAEKVAKLVVGKMSKGIMPPTVERKEMEKLGVKL